MERYHIKTGFKEEDIKKLKDFTNKLNNMKFKYTLHCLDNIKNRVIDLEGLLLCIKDITLHYDYIFEFYSEAVYIAKVCYRIPWNDNIDIILVLNDEKEIITIYLNSKEDNHITLKKELYRGITNE